MKKIILFSVLLFASIACFAQQKDVLFSVDNIQVTVAEFKKMYEKNLDLVKDEESKNIDSYLELYINFKLKVNEALALKLDTTRTFKREFSTHKNQIAAPYLQDNSLIDGLVKEAYYRTKNEIKASHILVRFPKKTDPKDSLQYYKKITNYYNRIKAGEPFAKVAFEVSEDPSAKRNYGNLDYFSAFKMVFPFEDVAYKTKLNEVSKPFKTPFGYHILKTTGLRVSKGEFDVAHILIDDTSIVGKSKIDTIYAKLQSGNKFEDLAQKFSSDRGSANKGGRLPRFGTGKMIPKFEEVVHSLKEEQEYSKPFKTEFGWHIVKLIKNYPVLSFEKMKKSLTKKVKSSGRAGSSNTALLKRLKKEYKINIDNKSLALFKNKKRRIFPKDSMQATLVTINNKKITQELFSNFSKHKMQLSINDALNKFIDTEIVKYFKENLINTEPEYKSTIQEYKEGLLLFDLMEQRIWNKASKDTIGLQQFFIKNKQFKNKNLEKVKGEAINAYQEFLEKKWVDDLRKKSSIRINKKALRKFKLNYK